MTNDTTDAAYPICSYIQDFLREEFNDYIRLRDRNGQSCKNVIFSDEKIAELEVILQTLNDADNTYLELRSVVEHSKICRLRERLVISVKGGHVTYAFETAQKLRNMGITELLRIEDRGQDVNQLKPAFWAAVTGNDKPDHILYNNNKNYSDNLCDSTLSLFNAPDGSELLNSTTTRGMTPLHWAAVFGHLDLIKRMIQFGADPSILSERNATILHEAAVGGDLETVVYFVEHHKIDPLLPDNKGILPIIWSLQENHINVFNYLLTKVQTLYLNAKEGWNILTEAVRAGNLNIVHFLINECDLSTKQENKYRHNLLHIACGNLKTNSSELVSTLIDTYNIKLDELDENGNTPLHVAVSCGNIFAAKIILQKFLNDDNYLYILDLKNDYGFAPLHLACDEPQKFFIVAELLQAGASVDIRDTLNSTPLFHAAYNNAVITVKLLLNASPCVNCSNKTGWTPIHIAATEGNIQILELLIDHLKDAKKVINTAEEEGWTPLLIAAQNGFLDVIKLLITNGADVKATTNNGNDALSIAISNNQMHVAGYLHELYKTEPKKNNIEISDKFDNQDNVLSSSDDNCSIDFSYFYALSTLLDCKKYDAARDKLYKKLSDAHIKDVLLYAIYLKNITVFDFLLKNGNLQPEILNFAAEYAAAFGSTEFVIRLIASGCEKPKLWSRPRVSDLAWFMDFKEPDLETSHNIYASLVDYGLTLSLSAERICFRIAPISFFPGHTLIAIENLFIPGQNEIFAIQNPEGTIIPLDWTNEPIYKLAENLPLTWDDQVVREYCLFFFHFVRGQYGCFIIAEKPEHIWWDGEETPENRIEVGKNLIPLHILERTKDGFIRLKGSIAFNDGLFTSEILLAIQQIFLIDQENGEKTTFSPGQIMIQNEKLLLEDQPFYSNTIRGLFG
jgi:ankyrin repeat protein